MEQKNGRNNLIMTTFTTTTSKWDGDPAKDRDKYIGGSDIGTILGLNPWKSAFTLWAEKTHKIDTPDISDKESVWWGNYDEEGVAKRFCEKTGKKVHRSLKNYSIAEYPFLIGHIDRAVVGENAGLECKTTSSFNKTDFDNGEIPPAHYAQVQLYMLVTGAAYWYYAVKRDNFQFFYQQVNRDDDFIENTMIPAAVVFWKAVQEDTPIKPDGSESSADTLSALYPGMEAPKKGKDTPIILLPDKITDKLETYLQLNEAEKQIKDQKGEIANEVKALMKDYRKGSTGSYSVSWSRSTKTVIDKDRLEAERPDIFEHYKQVKPNDRLTIRKKKEKEKNNG